MIMLGLKGFHVFFICASIVLCASVAFWGLQQYSRSARVSSLVMAIVFLVSAVALVIYALRYFGKLRRLDG